MSFHSTHFLALNGPRQSDVLTPESNGDARARVQQAGGNALGVALFQFFPGQVGGDDGETMFVRVTRCVEQTHLEAVKATSATFRLVLQSFHLLQPSIVVVVSIHNLKSKRLRIARALVLAYEVLLLRVDVGIAIIDSIDTIDAIVAIETIAKKEDAVGILFFPIVS